MIEKVRRKWDDDYTDLVIQTSFYLGLLSMGIAVGAGIGLDVLQWSCIDAGALPYPGGFVIDPSQVESSSCFVGAKSLKQTATRAALIGGGVMGFGFVIRHKTDFTEQ